MISHLRGVLLSKDTHCVVIDVGGVGYQASISLNTFYELPPEGLEVALHIHTHLREDQLSLFGFLSPEEKNLFLQLIKVSGVGPKLAMTLLSGLPYSQLAEAISKGDAAALQSISGIGKKVSERILIDMKGKFLPSKTGGQAVGSQSYDEALSALTHLGYSRPQADAALGRLDWSKELTLTEAIRQSLKNLSRG